MCIRQRRLLSSFICILIDEPHADSCVVHADGNRWIMIAPRPSPLFFLNRNRVFFLRRYVEDKRRLGVLWAYNTSVFPSNPLRRRRRRRAAASLRAPNNDYVVCTILADGLVTLLKYAKVSYRNQSVFIFFDHQKYNWKNTVRTTRTDFIRVFLKIFSTCLLKISGSRPMARKYIRAAKRHRLYMFKPGTNVEEFRMQKDAHIDFFYCNFNDVFVWARIFQSAYNEK